MRQSPTQLIPPIASVTGDVRIGPVIAIPDLLAEFGVRPRRAFAKAGVKPGLFGRPDSRIPFEALARLLSVCAAHTGCDHFGLLVYRAQPVTLLRLLGAVLVVTGMLLIQWKR